MKLERIGEWCVHVGAGQSYGLVRVGQCVRLSPGGFKIKWISSDPTSTVYTRLRWFATESEAVAFAREIMSGGKHENT